MKLLSRYARPLLLGSFLFTLPAFTSADTATINPENQRVKLLGLMQSLHRDAASAQQAAQSLGRMGGEAAMAAGDLVQALQFDEDSVYMAVSDALVSIGAPSIAPLKLVLGHPNFIVRRRAALILARFGPEAKRTAPGLVELLTDPHADVHDAAEKALISMGDAAIPALTHGLNAVGSGSRDVVIMTLGHFGSKAVPILLECLRKDENAYIRARAAESLGEVSPAPAEVQEGLIQALSDLQEDVRGTSVDSLSRLKPSAVSAIGPLIVVSQDDHDASTRKKAADALMHIGPSTRESLAGLIAAQHHANVDVRRKIVEVLGKSEMVWPDPLPALLNAMKDEDPSVRLKAVQVCAAKGKPGPNVLPIFKQAIGDAVGDIRSAAVLALGQWKDDSAAAAELSRALSDVNPVIRRQAIGALGQIGSVGLPGLLQALSDGSSLLSDEAGDAIVSLGQAAVPALQSLKSGPEPILQKKADSLLKRINGKTHHKKKKAK